MKREDREKSFKALEFQRFERSHRCCERHIAEPETLKP
jgi:hypothetical protein